MTLDEQRNMMERALSERMVNHALAILRQWAQELGFGPYVDRIHSITQSYNSMFDYYVAADDPDREAVHNKLTSDTLQLMDEMYADIRIKRGLSPEMAGFDEADIQGVLRYFSMCVHLREEDLDWYRDLVNDPQRRGMALMVLSALNNNLREHFQTDAFEALIETMGVDDPMISEQACILVILLLAQWDSRIDFFEHLQDVFMEHLGDGEEAFLAVKAIIRAANTNTVKPNQKYHITQDDLPDEVLNLMEDLSVENESVSDTIDRLAEYIPQSTLEYMQTIVDIFPDTWVFDEIIGEDESRIKAVKMLYLQSGSMEFMWDELDEAEEWLVARMRKNEATAQDYLNYGHIFFLRGDRMMAYENYKEAKRLCRSNKAFFDLFRPSRKALKDNGIPLEQIYLMEDQLLRLDA